MAHLSGSQTLFIYGSLSEGFVHFNRISDFIADLRPAGIRGAAYRLKVGFPVVLETGQEFVPGQCAEIRSPESLFPMLDQFHGAREDEPQSLHLRKKVQAFVDDQVQETYVYFLNPQHLPSNAVHIPGGDWLSSLKQSPSLCEKLTQEQRKYIVRLGTATGREVVPINLQLYRELMNLDLIVDKGRRLALSKLGHEVYRFL